MSDPKLATMNAMEIGTHMADALAYKYTVDVYGSALRRLWDACLRGEDPGPIYPITKEKIIAVIHIYVVEDGLKAQSLNKCCCKTARRPKVYTMTAATRRGWCAAATSSTVWTR